MAVSYPDRKIILNNKLRELEHEIQEIQDSIDYIHWKQDLYDDFLTGKKEYYSFLINTEKMMTSFKSPFFVFLKLI